jgi:hypothetical protein
MFVAFGVEKKSTGALVHLQEFVMFSAVKAASIILSK